MKKVCKHIGAVTVVITVLFALAITAYAASWKNSGRFSGTGYSGYYKADMNFEDNSASASLNVSDYQGMVYLGGGASIDGYACTKYSSMPYPVKKSSETTYCYGSVEKMGETHFT